MCRIACSRQENDETQWCGECRQELERYRDRQGEIAALSLAHREHDEITPATDTEWAARLDEMAPMVGVLSA
jgi:hypothetical protein